MFFKRSFNKHKDMAVFCIGKMFDRISLIIIVYKACKILYINK